ncbi:cytokine receptor-like factor 1 [Lingula anatina]|uniref:Cytokine receptor-like factor 1 n=1 Tax=Lingula anatina TaxID=7574 RepID=A0A2R2MM25_LINAN|nr:cytokine receptor-like factor 1 [Lingula anatina]|eukprot:XP_023931107.1 cytokine receptor-like factor 1 [Lingula anatina]
MESLRMRMTTVYLAILIPCAVFAAPMGVKPKVADNIRCISNNFEDMICSWEVVDSAQIAQDSNYTLLWTVHPGSLNLCPHTKGNTCRFQQDDGIDSFKAGFIYYVIVRGTHPEHGESFSSYEMVNTYEIVKPKPVRELKTLDKGQSHLQLSWTHPENLSSNRLYSGLMYNVLLESEHGTIKEIETRQEGARVDGLIPNTLYKVSIKAKPGRGGYWSEAARITTTTS